MCFILFLDLSISLLELEVEISTSGSVLDSNFPRSALAVDFDPSCHSRYRRCSHFKYLLSEFNKMILNPDVDRVILPLLA